MKQHFWIYYTQLSFEMFLTAQQNKYKHQYKKNDCIKEQIVFAPCDQI